MSDEHVPHVKEWTPPAEAAPPSTPKAYIEAAIGEISARFPGWEPSPAILSYARGVATIALDLAVRDICKSLGIALPNSLDRPEPPLPESARTAVARSAARQRRRLHMSPWLAVAAIDDGRFAVLEIEPMVRVGRGCQATVHSIHATEDEARAEVRMPVCEQSAPGGPRHT